MRRKPPPPASSRGLTTQELTARTGIRGPQLHRWVRAGLLEGHPSRGRGVRYDEAFVRRATTIDRLLREGMTLAEIRVRLERGEAEPPAPAPAPAAPPPPPPSPSLPSPGPAPAQAPPELPSERLERIVLIPGLELTFRADAGPVLRRLAAEIWSQFGSTAGR